MDENKVEVANTAEQEASNAGMEAETEPTAEAVQAEKEPTAGATEPAAEQKNDTETEQETAGKDAHQDGNAAGTVDSGDEKTEVKTGASMVEPAAAVVNEQLETVKKELLTARAEGAAIQAGIRPDRIKQAVKLAELSGIDPLSDGAEDKIAEKLKAVSESMPEWLTPTGTGAAGAFARKAEQPKDPFERGFSKA